MRDFDLFLYVIVKAEKNIPVGRYKVTGNSNFVVRSAGGGNIGVDSYVFQANDGDVIHFLLAFLYD
ncbi:hypothetical protein NKR74_18700 [Bacillus sp. 3103sda1]|uniref:hypothetical protein n=1 Tax=unclassified Bacillus (in: firmicutes) TaxID=185979 RepID=UPI0011457B70|nr:MULTISPECIES: hypothetical protein [unclassified Bacillus (in: firmicutes)]MCP1125323.1 hypothetical protein [Bacillus sp. 3103sda1]